MITYFVVNRILVNFYCVASIFANNATPMKLKILILTFAARMSLTNRP